MDQRFIERKDFLEMMQVIGDSISIGLEACAVLVVVCIKNKNKNNGGCLYHNYHNCHYRVGRLPWVEQLVLGEDSLVTPA